MTFIDNLKFQLKKYPKHEASDIYKMIYQGEFAGGHIIHDESKHLAWLKREIDENAEHAYSEIEPISPLYTRFHLAGFHSQKLSLNTLEKMILNTANDNEGRMEAFEKKLSIWASLENVDAFIQKMKSQQYPLVHHSELYRKHYKPAYRIISHSYGFYMNIFKAIDEKLAHQERVVIAIDGDAGSGKSQFAALLQSIYRSTVIKMDHFFLRDSQRTSSRLKEIGGNVDYERFMYDVIRPLKYHESFVYEPYNCQTHQFDSTIEVLNKPLIIVEGSYSLRKEFRDAYDIKVVLHLNHKIQIKRLKQRNSKLFPRFEKEWIPKEKAYAKTTKLDESADFIFDTSEVFNKS